MLDQMFFLVPLCSDRGETTVHDSFLSGPALLISRIDLFSVLQTIKVDPGSQCHGGSETLQT